MISTFHPSQFYVLEANLKQFEILKNSLEIELLHPDPTHNQPNANLFIPSTAFQIDQALMAFSQIIKVIHTKSKTLFVAIKNQIFIYPKDQIAAFISKGIKADNILDMPENQDIVAIKQYNDLVIIQTKEKIFSLEPNSKKFSELGKSLSQHQIIFQNTANETKFYYQNQEYKVDSQFVINSKSFALFEKSFIFFDQENKLFLFKDNKQILLNFSIQQTSIPQIVHIISNFYLIVELSVDMVDEDEFEYAQNITLVQIKNDEISIISQLESELVKNNKEFQTFQVSTYDINAGFMVSKLIFVSGSNTQQLITFHFSGSNLVKTQWNFSTFINHIRGFQILEFDLDDEIKLSNSAESTINLYQDGKYLPIPMPPSIIIIDSQNNILRYWLLPIDPQNKIINTKITYPGKKQIQQMSSQIFSNSNPNQNQGFGFFQNNVGGLFGNNNGGQQQKPIDLTQIEIPNPMIATTNTLFGSNKVEQPQKSLFGQPNQSGLFVAPTISQPLNLQPDLQKTIKKVEQNIFTVDFPNPNLILVEKDNLESLENKGMLIKQKKNNFKILEGTTLSYDTKLKYLQCGLFLYIENSTVTIFNETDFEKLLSQQIKMNELKTQFSAKFKIENILIPNVDQQTLNQNKKQIVYLLSLNSIQQIEINIEKQSIRDSEMKHQELNITHCFLISDTLCIISNKKIYFTDSFNQLKEVKDVQCQICTGRKLNQLEFISIEKDIITLTQNSAFQSQSSTINHELKNIIYCQFITDDYFYFVCYDNKKIIQSIQKLENKAFTPVKQIGFVNNLLNKQLEPQNYKFDILKYEFNSSFNLFIITSNNLMEYSVIIQNQSGFKSYIEDEDVKYLPSFNEEISTTFSTFFKFKSEEGLTQLPQHVHIESTFEVDCPISPSIYLYTKSGCLRRYIILSISEKQPQFKKEFLKEQTNIQIKLDDNLMKSKDIQNIFNNITIQTTQTNKNQAAITSDIEKKDQNKAPEKSKDNSKDNKDQPKILQDDIKEIKVQPKTPLPEKPKEQSIIPKAEGLPKEQPIKSEKDLPNETSSSDSNIEQAKVQAEKQINLKESTLKIIDKTQITNQIKDVNSLKSTVIKIRNQLESNQNYYSYQNKQWQLLKRELDFIHQSISEDQPQYQKNQQLEIQNQIDKYEQFLRTYSFAIQKEEQLINEIIKVYDQEIKTYKSLSKPNSTTDNTNSIIPCNNNWEDAMMKKIQTQKQAKTNNKISFNPNQEVPFNSQVIHSNIETLSYINAKLSANPKRNQISFNVLDETSIFKQIPDFIQPYKAKNNKFQITEQIRNNFQNKMTNFKCVQSSGLNCRKFVIDIDNYTITKDVPVFKNILDKPKDHEVSFKKTENSSFVTSTTAFVNPIEKKDIPKAIPSNDQQPKQQTSSLFLQQPIGNDNSMLNLNLKRDDQKINQTFNSQQLKSDNQSMINTCLPTFKMEDKPSIFNFNKPETNTNSTSDPATKSLFQTQNGNQGFFGSNPSAPNNFGGFLNSIGNNSKPNEPNPVQSGKDLNLKEKNEEKEVKEQKDEQKNKQIKLDANQPAESSLFPKQESKPIEGMFGFNLNIKNEGFIFGGGANKTEIKSSEISIFNNKQEASKETPIAKQAPLEMFGSKQAEVPSQLFGVKDLKITTDIQSQKSDEPQPGPPKNSLKKCTSMISNEEGDKLNQTQSKPNVVDQQINQNNQQIKTQPQQSLFQQNQSIIIPQQIQQPVQNQPQPNANQMFQAAPVNTTQQSGTFMNAPQFGQQGLFQSGQMKQTGTLNLGLPKTSLFQSSGATSFAAAAAANANANQTQNQSSIFSNPNAQQQFFQSQAQNEQFMKPRK